MANLLLDTNILLLLIVGSWDKSSISRFKRTNQFDAQDFELLSDELTQYTGLVTTPAILTESSNLIRGDLHEQIAPIMIRLFEASVEAWTEKSDVTAEPSFARLGYSDAMTITLAGEGTVVLTDDLDLYLELSYRQRAVINFNHLRRRFNG